ncbi:myotubularin-related protein 9-like [Actinia tenebrosa]|uniref:Myotubularin-related protein 9-like n=1 Tax=Actinia tenebrosa TaxID=6105 RepID=A0A6P8H2J4_ACTTE|nr:myotubularin-related protein 9-like [Actinia tenebrosa]
MEFVEYIKSPRIEKVLLKRRHGTKVEGTLCVTGHHLIFSSRTQHEEELFLLHSAVESIEKKILSGEQAILTICCKNFDLVKLEFSNTEEALNVASSIEDLSVIDDSSLKYPFFYRHLQSLSEEDGWDMFSTDIEFSMMCTSTQNWRISHVNRDYKTCPSYPSSVIVPATVTDEDIKASAQFRQGGRFPVLSYFHKPTGVAVLRSGQPVLGLGNRRCKDDEKLINAALKEKKKGIIVDTRSQAATINSRSKGGGIEPESNYPQWKRVNHNIEKYSALNDSIAKLVEGALDHHLSMNSWLSKLESSGWLDHVQAVLSSAHFVATCVDKQGVPVLVHGDAGYDATLQVTSLVQVILEPNCRTVKGFQGLIDREWLRAGYPFATRCIKVGVSPIRYKGQGPCFLLFLECVWQIYQQFPCSFQFNDKFLQFLYQHSYYSQFGTFLCNNEFERAAIKLKKKTISLWSFINQREVIAPMLNSMYEMNVSAIWPSVSSQSLSLWSGLFLKWQKSHRNGDFFWEEVRRIQNNNKELKHKAVSLRKEFAQLQASLFGR